MDGPPIDLTSPLVQNHNQKAQQESIIVLTSDSDEAECQEDINQPTIQGITQTQSISSLDPCTVRAEGSKLGSDESLLDGSLILETIEGMHTPKARDSGSFGLLPAQTPNLLSFIESRLEGNGIDGGDAGVDPACVLGFETRHLGMRDGAISLGDGVLTTENNGQGKSNPVAVPGKEGCILNTKASNKTAAQERKQKEREEKKVAKQLKANLAQQEATERKRVQAEEKQARALEKERARLNRGKNALQEIKVLVSNAAVESPFGPQALQRLGDANLKYSIYSCPLDQRQCFQWERNPTFDAGSEVTEHPTKKMKYGPPDKQGSVIPYVLVVLEAEAFVKEVQEDGMKNLLQEAACHYPDSTLSLMVVGLERYLTRREAKEFQQVEATEPVFVRRPIDEFKAALPIKYPGIQCSFPMDAADATDILVQLTTALAKQPYQPLSNFLSRFGGGLKNSKDSSENSQAALVNVLQAVPGVALNNASTIGNAYPSLGALLEQFEDDSSSEHTKASLLADLITSSSTRRRVGPGVSEKIFRLLTCTDPETMVDSLC